jgi:hypothetical protein
VLGPQHTASAVDAVVYDKEVVVSWERVLVYAVEAAFLGGAAEAVAGWD